MRYCLWFVIIFLCLGVLPVSANEKYVTIVNPIRSRQYWRDKNLNVLTKQYAAIHELNLKATWLIQDDVLADPELVNNIKQFDTNQEQGLFLEVSKNVADAARVYYPTQVEWYNPKAIFLSGYPVSQRKLLIDKMLTDFTKTFGHLPKSAGAWWIDSWTQQYLEKKYGITAYLIVADQKTTDNYGVWGQWWGYPYHPSPNNILTPGISPSVVIQWAQRDLAKAYFGEGRNVSNYSLQANDYTSQGLGFTYFKTLATHYLSVEPLGQITLGLETGIESVGQEAEYARQLHWLVDTKITSLTMSSFADKYRQVYGYVNPKQVLVQDWTLTPEYRENKSLSERTNYADQIAFKDKFVPDQNSFLNRVLPKTDNRPVLTYWPLFLLLIPLLWWISKNPSPVLWTVVLFLPLFRSYYDAGWQIFFGPVVSHLILVQILVLAIASLSVSFLYKKSKIDWSAWWSVWTVNLIVFKLRFSLFDGKYYAGWLVDNFRFVGLVVGNGLKIINQDLAGYVAASMYKFDPAWIWDKVWVWALVYPLIELMLVWTISRVVPQKLRCIIAIFAIGFVCYLLLQDPLVAI